MASTKSIEAAERKAAEASARAERLRAHDALCSVIAESLKASRRKDYAHAMSCVMSARNALSVLCEADKAASEAVK